MATTEHFNLQTARASTISEANGRASIYLAAVSSNLIALAFIGQMSRLGTAFYAFSLILLPVLAFVGVVTFQRLVQSSFEDVAYAQRIARLRNLYVALAPELEPYLLSRAGDRREPARRVARAEQMAANADHRRHGRGRQQRGDCRLGRSRPGRRGRRVACGHARGRSGRRRRGPGGAPRHHRRVQDATSLRGSIGSPLSSPARRQPTSPNRAALPRCNGRGNESCGRARSYDGICGLRCSRSGRNPGQSLNQLAVTATPTRPSAAPPARSPGWPWHGPELQQRGHGCPGGWDGPSPSGHPTSIPDCGRNGPGRRGPNRTRR